MARKSEDMKIDEPEEKKSLEPQWVCMTCKTVIGPVVDDDKNRCNCKDDYLIDLWRLVPVEDKMLEIYELETRAAQEVRTSKEREYWQGRKDGLRLALSILEPGERIWPDLLKSSHGFRVEEKEALLNFLKDARFSIGAALWEYSEKPDRRIHIQAIVNLLQWVSFYDQKAEAGDVIPAPNAITPDWGLLTTGKRTPKGDS